MLSAASSGFPSYMWISIKYNPISTTQEIPSNPTSAIMQKNPCYAVRHFQNLAIGRPESFVIFHLLYTSS